MVGYLLKNTLSENGYVSRGVCEMDETGRLTALTERTHIITSADGPLMTEDLHTYTRLEADTVVSMNMWAFPYSMMAALEKGADVDSLTAAREKIAAGATLVQIYSGFIYQGPGLIKDIVTHL